MAQVTDQPLASLESLSRECVQLKTRIEEDRAKARDIDLPGAAERVEALTALNMKARRVLKGHQGKVLAMDWSRVDPRRLISASYDGRLIIWDAFSSSKDHVLPIAATWQMACAFSPSSTLVASGGLDNKCLVYALPSSSGGALDKKRTVAIHTSYVSACKFLHSDHQVLTSSGDSTCGLWDVESGTQIECFRGHLGDVICLDCPPSDVGNLFISGGCDRAAYVWDMRTGGWVQQFDAHDADVNTIRFHPSGDAFATGSDDATCRLFDLRADRELCVYRKESVMFAVGALDFSLSGRLLFAGGSDFVVNLWDTLRATRLQVLNAHENRVSCLQLCPDGTAVATGSWDASLKVWA